jgi:hypothetical protein
MRIIKSEDEEQALLVAWLQIKDIRHYAVPNGGKRDIVEAVKFKRTGVSPGVPDLCIPLPRSLYHGLYIELKRVSGSTISEKQQEWIDFLRKEGYRAEVAKGAEQAKAIVVDYLGLAPLPD